MSAGNKVKIQRVGFLYPEEHSIELILPQDILILQLQRDIIRKMIGYDISNNIVPVRVTLENGKVVNIEVLDVVSYMNTNDVNSSLSFRSKKSALISLLKSYILLQIREYLSNQKFVEIIPPSIIFEHEIEHCKDVRLFELNYYGKKAFLSSSAQFHLEALVVPLVRVYAISKSCRFESKSTRYHLTEYIHIEAEAIDVTFYGMLAMVENLIKHVVKNIIKNKNVLNIVNRIRIYNCGKIFDTIAKTVLNNHFKIIEYKDLTLEHKLSTKYLEEEEIPKELEVNISKKINVPTFVIHWPMKFKAPYFATSSTNANVFECGDLWLPGIGEVVAIGKREIDPQIIRERFIKCGVPQEKIAWYLQIRKSNPGSTGFGLGFERLVQWITCSETIYEVVEFPRLP